MNPEKLNQFVLRHTKLWKIHEKYGNIGQNFIAIETTENVKKYPVLYVPRNTLLLWNLRVTFCYWLDIGSVVWHQMTKWCPQVLSIAAWQCQYNKIVTPILQCGIMTIAVKHVNQCLMMDVVQIQTVLQHQSSVTKYAIIDHRL